MQRFEHTWSIPQMSICECTHNQAIHLWTSTLLVAVLNTGLRVMHGSTAGHTLRITTYMFPARFVIIIFTFIYSYDILYAETLRCLDKPTDQGWGVGIIARIFYSGYSWSAGQRCYTVDCFFNRLPTILPIFNDCIQWKFIIWQFHRSRTIGGLLQNAPDYTARPFECFQVHQKWTEQLEIKRKGVQ